MQAHPNSGPPHRTYWLTTEDGGANTAYTAAGAGHTVLEETLGVDDAGDDSDVDDDSTMLTTAIQVSGFGPGAEVPGTAESSGGPTIAVKPPPPRRGSSISQG